MERLLEDLSNLLAGREQLIKKGSEALDDDTNLRSSVQPHGATRVGKLGYEQVSARIPTERTVANFVTKSGKSARCPRRKFDKFLASSVAVRRVIRNSPPQ
ncbi:hypothetical protein ACOMHN_055838 [Nucella lapillus]